MTISKGFLIAVSALNVACAAISVGQLPRADAADVRVSDTVRTRHLEVVDGEGRVRASITVHQAAKDAASPDASDEGAVVFRLINTDGRPGVKLASSPQDVGLALIARQGDYLQVFGDGVKVTKDFRQRAAWP